MALLVLLTLLLQLLASDASNWAVIGRSLSNVAYRSERFLKGNYTTVNKV
jgi:hypothetical protein